MFDGFKKYHSEYGHCKVPLAYHDNDAPRALGQWCLEQHKNIHAGLTKDNADNDYNERKKLLNLVGFKWIIGSEGEEF